MKPKGLDHISHIAMRESERHLEYVATLPELGPGQEEEEMNRVMSGVFGLFVAGIEFSARFAARYPEHVEAVVAWCSRIPSPGEAPLELRERAMQDDARRIVEGCDSA